LKDALGEQFDALDPDAELALQAEEDVQEIDRLGPQVTLERRRRPDLVLVQVQASTSVADTFWSLLSSISTEDVNLGSPGFRRPRGLRLPPARPE
jgi:hypothetical protein